MKELKTDLGIEYEIEIVKIYDDAVDMRAVCEEGDKEFFIDLGYKINACQTTYAAFHDTRDYSVFEDYHLTEINNWVNEITVGFVAKEIAMWCVRKSDERYYWSFDIVRHSRSLSVSLCKHDKDNRMKITESHYLHGEDEIKDFLFYNK